jgi:hypothetical protein
MKLKELKKSTLYQSSDLDEMEIMIAVCRNGQTQYEPLCFMGWQPLPENPEGGFVVIGGLTEIQRLVESGKIPAPEGYISPEQSNLGYDDQQS